MTPLQLRALDRVREFVAVTGCSPSIREIAADLSIGIGTAHQTVTQLVRAGQLARGPEKVRNLRVAAQPDLRSVPTDVIAAELARRGVTLASLDARAPAAVGQKAFCAIETCGAGVERGHLMCRPHWLGLPRWLRDRILRTNATRDRRGFEAAVTEARATVAAGERRRA